MPSACVVLTSAPSFSNVRTASRLPFIAASTNAAAPIGAAWVIVVRLSATIAQIERPVVSVFRMSAPEKPSALSPQPLTFGCVSESHRVGVQIEFAGAVAEALQIGAAERVQRAEHRVGH